MISSQTRRQIEGFDELIREDDPDFESSGLKTSSLIRTGRLAVVEESMLLGAIGEIDSKRLQRIVSNLANWLTELHEHERE